jgi:hypothetical protein
MGPTGLGVRWLRHVTKEHGGCDHVLAGSPKNRGLDCPILDDATVNVASSLSSSSAVCACHTLLLKGLLKWAQIFSFLVEPVLQLVDLLELHSLIRKELSLMSFSRELDLRWRVPSFNDCLIL